MKRILSYLTYVFFLLGVLNIYFFVELSDFSMSISFFLMCIGCIVAIPKLIEDLKKSSSKGSMVMCRRTIAIMIMGAIFCFVLSIQFLPCFDS